MIRSLSISRICRMSVVILAATVSVSAYASSLITRDPVIKITNISASGPGCPEGSTAENISDDIAFTEVYDSFLTEVNAPTVRSSTAVCDVTMHLTAPSGYSYSFLGFDVRGFANTDTFGYATITSYFKLRSSWVLAGYKYIPKGFNSDVIVPSHANILLTKYSDCNGIDRDVTVRLKITARGKRSVVGIDSIDGEMRNHLHVARRICAD